MAILELSKHPELSEVANNSACWRLMWDRGTRRIQIDYRRAKWDEAAPMLAKILPQLNRPDDYVIHPTTCRVEIDLGDRNLENRLKRFCNESADNPVGERQNPALFSQAVLKKFVELAKNDLGPGDSKLKRSLPKAMAAKATGSWTGKASENGESPKQTARGGR